MGGDPKDEGLGSLSGFLEAIIQSYDTISPDLQLKNFRTDALDAGTLDTKTNRLFDAGERNINRSIGQAGQLAAGRGYSQGLSNPFAYAQHAENQARSGLGNLEAQRAQSLLGNEQTAYNTQLGSNQANINNLLALLGMKGGVVSQRQGNVVPGIATGIAAGAASVGKGMIGG